MLRLRFFNRKCRTRGASTFEYALLLGLIGTVATAALNQTGTATDDVFGDVANSVVGAADGGTTGGSGDDPDVAILDVLGPGAGDYAPGTTLDFTVAFDDDHDLAGGEYLAIDVGGTVLQADLVADKDGDDTTAEFELDVPTSIPEGSTLSWDNTTINGAPSGGAVDVDDGFGDLSDPDDALGGIVITDAIKLPLAGDVAPSASDWFGHRVAIDGSRVVVSASQEDGQAGAAYVMDATTGALQHRLTSTGRLGGDFFGESVAIDGDTVVVGAYQPESNNNRGRAFVYDLAGAGTDITETIEIAPSSPRDLSFFGHGVAVDGDRVLVGASLGGGASTFSGLVYVFDIAGASPGSTVNEDYVLYPSDGVDSDRFGRRVALDGTTAVVAAHRDDASSSSTQTEIVTLGEGALYVYDLAGVTTNTTEDFKIEDPAPGENQFGISIDVDGNRIVAGSYRDDTDGTDAGRAWVFDASTGAQLFELMPNAADADAGNFFGNGTAIDGSTVAVGAFTADGNVADSGAVYLFDLVGSGQLTPTETLTGYDSAANDTFGVTVDIQAGQRAIVGSPQHDGQRGEAYILPLD